MLGKGNQGYGVVLYYHAVPPEYCSRFAWQMDDVLRWAKPITLGTRQSIEPGCRYAAITFDDGFTSVIENALPETLKRNIPVTLFVPTGNLGQHPKWITDHHSPEADEVVITAEKLKELNKNPLVNIGSHCVSHSNLLNLNDDKVKRELKESRQMLESILGQDVQLLSFPHGAYNEKIVSFAIEAGYQHMFTILPKLAFTDPFEHVTGRVMVEPTDWRLEFRLKLFGAYQWLPAVFKMRQTLYQFIGKTATQIL